MTAVQGEPLSAKEGRGWTADDGTFGARLALVRQRMQWNIKEAAGECLIPAASWASWEAGAQPRRYAEMCQKIADRTGADYVWLMVGPVASRPSGTSRRGNDLNASLRQFALSAEIPPPNVQRHAARHDRVGPSAGPTSPIMTPRRASTRPGKPIDPRLRRPMPVTGPIKRPMPHAGSDDQTNT